MCAAIAMQPHPQTTLVILLGASAWPYCPEFAKSQAFTNAAQSIKKYLQASEHFALPKENLLDLFDRGATADAQDREIADFLDERRKTLKQEKTPARDLLLYFVGHGGFVNAHSDLYLALRSTRTENRLVSGFSAPALATTLTEKARFLRQYIVLDCCFAAAASPAFQNSPAEIVAVKTSNAFEVRGYPSKGLALYCSSHRELPSKLMPDESSTMFSWAFLQALTQGDPDGSQALSLRDLDQLIRQYLQGIPDAPPPHLSSPRQTEGDLTSLPFFPNPAFSMVSDGATTEPSHTRAFVIPSSQASSTDRNPSLITPPSIASWQGEAVIQIGEVEYMLYDPVEEQKSSDQSFVWHQAKAEQLSGQSRTVWLRQVQILRPTPKARERWEALRQEAELLTELENVIHVPRVIQLQREQEYFTLVHSYPKALTWKERFASSHHLLDRYEVRNLLSSVLTLCTLLGTIHRMQRAHRALDLSTVLVLQGPHNRASVLRDLGFATLPPQPEEASSPYQAPEQIRMDLTSRRSVPGARTDIYRLAAILYHLLTRHLPDTSSSGILLPPSTWNTVLPLALDEVLLKALAPSVDERWPTIFKFASELKHTIAHLRNS